MIVPTIALAVALQSDPPASSADSGLPAVEAPADDGERSSQPDAVRGVAPRNLYWLPTAAFVLHSAEELPRFPAWATRHFGTTTTEFFVLSHIPLVALSATTSYLAERHGPGSIWATLATAWQWQLVVNGLFHLTATALFDEYSPGVITGTAVVFPASFYFFDQTLRRDLLAPPRLWTALAIGSLVAGLAIASLALDNDVRF